MTNNSITQNRATVPKQRSITFKLFAYLTALALLWGVVVSQLTTDWVAQSNSSVRGGTVAQATPFKAVMLQCLGAGAKPLSVAKTGKDPISYLGSAVHGRGMSRQIATKVVRMPMTFGVVRKTLVGVVELRI